MIVLHVQALNVLAKQLVNVRKQKTRTYSAQSKVSNLISLKTHWNWDDNMKYDLRQCFFSLSKLFVVDKTKPQVQAVGSASKVSNSSSRTQIIKYNFSIHQCLLLKTTTLKQTMIPMKCWRYWCKRTQAMGANVKMAETMGATSKVMADMNKMMNPQQVRMCVTNVGFLFLIFENQFLPLYPGGEEYARLWGC